MKRTPSEALQYLQACVREIGYHPYAMVAQHCIDDPAFRRCFGGEKHHHVYEGALMIHTAEVMDWVRSAVSYSPIKLNRDVLWTAVICHDYAKVKDYQWFKKQVETQQGPTIEVDSMEAAPYKRHIHHVQGSAIEFAYLLRIFSDGSVTCNEEEDVVHCILSHHGRKEWGSQIEPLTPEATILHWADYMSMRFGEGR